MKPKVFNVLLWDFNSDSLTYYDVLPYFRDCYKHRKNRKPGKGNSLTKSPEFNDYFNVPKTLEEFKKFVQQESLYQFWSRCQYEMICHGWPVQKKDHKLDVHEQIMMNIDTISEILYNEIHSEK